MRRVNLIVLAVIAVHLLTASLALGQGGNPPASTKESGATSGHGMTAVEQAGQKAPTRRYINLPTRPRSDPGFLMSTMSEAFGWAITLRALRVREEVATYKQPPSNRYQTAVRCMEPSSFSVPKLAMKRPIRISSAPDGVVLA